MLTLKVVKNSSGQEIIQVWKGELIAGVILPTEKGIKVIGFRQYLTQMTKIEEKRPYPGTISINLI